MSFIDNFVPINYELFKKIVVENPAEKTDFKVHYFVSGENTVLMFRTQNWAYRSVIRTADISKVDKSMGFLAEAVNVMTPPDSSSVYEPLISEMSELKTLLKDQILKQSLEEINVPKP